MQTFTETGQSHAERAGWSRFLHTKRLIAGFAVFVSAWSVAGCSGSGHEASAAVGSRSPTVPAPLTPGPGNPRADVFLRGIAALPNNLELETIVDRICRLREEDSRAAAGPGRVTPGPNAGEVVSLEQGYNQLYATTNSLPWPGQSNEQWALREERQQCPQVAPRTFGPPQPS